MSERADVREERTRDAIASTARTLREASAVPMTQTEAEARVLRARRRGDNIRNSDR